MIHVALWVVDWLNGWYGVVGLSALNGWLQLKHKFNFHAGSKGQGIGGDGSADVPAGIAKKFEQKLAGCVGNLGLLGELIVRVDECTDANDAFEAVDVAEGVLCGGQRVDDALTGAQPCLIDGALGGDVPLGKELAIFHGKLTGDKEQIAALFGGDISTEWAGKCGQSNIQLSEFVR